MKDCVAVSAVWSPLRLLCMETQSTDHASFSWKTWSAAFSRSTSPFRYPVCPYAVQMRSFSVHFIVDSDFNVQSAGHYHKIKWSEPNYDDNCFWKPWKYEKSLITIMQIQILSLCNVTFDQSRTKLHYNVLQMNMKCIVCCELLAVSVCAERRSQYKSVSHVLFV